MNRTDPITLAEVLELQPGTKENPTWVNGVLTVEVGNVEIKQAKNGGTFIVCDLYDPDSDAAIGATLFGRKAFPFDGAIVTIDCTGVSLGAYNGTPQLTIGAKARVNKVGGAAQPPPARQEQRPAARQGQTPPARQGAPAAKSGGTVLGVTVGMALNNAVQSVNAWNAYGFPDETLSPGTTAWAERVYNVASDLLRLSRTLEQGKVSPPASQRAGSNDATQDEQGQEDQGQEEPAQEEAPPPRRARVVRQDPPRPHRSAESRPIAGPDGSVDTSGIDPNDVPF